MKNSKCKIHNIKLGRETKNEMKNSTVFIILHFTFL